jgi:membrane fusion protein
MHIQPLDPLFRHEAVDHAATRLLGKVLIPSPSLLILGALFSISLLSGIAVLFVQGSYTPRQTVPGFLHPERGLVRVFAQRSGKVDLVHVREGDTVRFQQPVAIVSLEQALRDSEGRSALERILQELVEQERRLGENLGHETQTDENTRTRINSRIEALRAELHAQRAEQSVLEEQKQNAELLLSRILELHGRGYVTEFDVIGRKQPILELERQLHALERSIATSENQLREAELEIRQQGVQLRQRKAELQNRISDIRRQIAGYEIERGYVITAPIGGRVTALQIEPGKPVTPAQPILSILADDAVLEAHLMVPSRAVGFLKEGQPVRIRYAAFPYQQYGSDSGHVTEISRTSLRPEEFAVQLPLVEPMYRIKARLDRQSLGARGSEYPLQAGMLLEADILMEDRPLWAWLLEPLLSFRGRL